jgi:hypothetical protein
MDITRVASWTVGSAYVITGGKSEEKTYMHRKEVDIKMYVK